MNRKVMVFCTHLNPTTDTILMRESLLNLEWKTFQVSATYSEHFLSQKQATEAVDIRLAVCY